MTSWGIEKAYFNAIEHYLAFLLEENKKLNLISRKLPFDTILTDHVYDCLAGRDYFTESRKILDIGAGGGFPGILLASVFPTKEFTLIDKSIKKTNFLKSAVKELKLQNVRIICSPITDAKPGKEIDTITCRAFKSICEIISFTSSLFKKNVKYILYKGKKEKIDEELEIAGKQFKFTCSINRIETNNEKERHIVLLERV